MARRPSHWPTKFSVKAAAFGSLEHPLHLLDAAYPASQSPPLRQAEKLFVGRRGPQEIRQPAGQGEVVELAGLLLKKQEIR